MRAEFRHALGAGLIAVVAGATGACSGSGPTDPAGDLPTGIVRICILDTWIQLRTPSVTPRDCRCTNDPGLRPASLDWPARECPTPTPPRDSIVIVNPRR